MGNTANALSAQTIIEDFKAIGALEYLKIYLVTGATDISKSYELVKQFIRNARCDADKVIYMRALVQLESIALRRIDLTSILYNANEMETIEKEENKTILMLPSLDEELAKVRNMFKDCENITKARDIAFIELKATVGNGKVMNSEKQAITWDNNKINQVIDSIVNSMNVDSAKAKTVETETTKVETTENDNKGESFGFKTIYEHLNEMAKNGNTEEEIKTSLKTLLIGKVITNDGNDTFLIKDEKVFDGYYDRYVAVLVTSSVKDYNDKKKIADNETNLEKEIETTIIPALKDVDKDEKQSSFAPIVFKLRDLYKKFNIALGLSDSLTKVQELATTVAPNLLSRNKKSNSNDLPTVPIGCENLKKEEPEQTVLEAENTPEIYDESHNIKESNKELWTEVENYNHLQQILDKSMDLYKRGLWKDALSMSIILISSGKISKWKDGKEKVLWDTEQIKAWFTHSIKEAIDPSAVEIKDGPAVKAGTLDAQPKEDVTKLIKDVERYQGKYTFKTFSVKSNRGKPAVMFQVLNATSVDESEVLITETNMFRFLDDLRQDLVKSGNNLPKTRSSIREEFGKFYELTGSEIKGIAGQLLDEASTIRKANKESTSLAKEVASGKPIISTSPDTTKKEEGEVVSPPEESVKESSKSEKPTENTSTKDTTNSNDKPSYDDFEDIVKANTKIKLHEAMYRKACEYATIEEAKKAIFAVIDVARHDKRYKGKTQIGNWNPTPAGDLLNMVNKIIDTGVELAKQKKLEPELAG